MIWLFTGDFRAGSKRLGEENSFFPPPRRIKLFAHVTRSTALTTNCMNTHSGQSIEHSLCFLFEVCVPYNSAMRCQHEYLCGLAPRFMRGCTCWTGMVPAT